MDRRIETAREVSDDHELVTRYRYDANGNQVLQILPEGNANQTSFDERDLVYQSIRGALLVPPEALMAPGDSVSFDIRGGFPCECTTFRYDGNRNIVEIADSDDTDLSAANNSDLGGGDRTRQVFDGFDRLAERYRCGWQSNRAAV